MTTLEPRDVPPRLAIGAFILNSGLGKLKADAETAQGVHGMACVAYPFLKKIDPERFTRMLAWSEITVGGTLLAPFVPTRLAGLALTGFSGGWSVCTSGFPGCGSPGAFAPPRTASRSPRTSGCWASVSVSSAPMSAGRARPRPDAHGTGPGADQTARDGTDDARLRGGARTSKE